MIDFPTAVRENIECIYANYETAFCGSCGCQDICKNKKSNNILKATLLIRELEILQNKGAAADYNDKLELFTPVFAKLCLCQ